MTSMFKVIPYYELTLWKRGTGLKANNLDLLYFYSLPTLAWIATENDGIWLKLLTDADMCLMP